MVAGSIIGLTVAAAIIVFRPVRYTSSTDIILLNQQGEFDLPDIPGLSGLLPQVAGQVLQDPSNIKDAAYAYILMSPSVRLRVARDTFRVGDTSRPMTLVQYVEETYDEQSDLAGQRESPKLSMPEVQISAPERQALHYLDENVAAFTDPNPRTITLEVTTASPELSGSIANRMVFHFRNHLRELRREKFGEEANYLRSQLENTREQLRDAESRLSRFEGRNQGQKTARLETKRDRLERDVRMVERKYQYLLERTREIEKKIENDESPFETLDRPVVPSKSSNAPVPLVGAVFTLLGLFVGTSVALGWGTLANEHVE